MNNKQITIATIGSHSALEVAMGAKDEGFKNLIVCQIGREKTYAKYYKTQGALGCVDEVLLVDKFSDVLNSDVQKKLKNANSIFIPNRSFEVYINDYDAIEKKFTVPMFGNKKLLRVEERGHKPNQYDLLDAAKIRYPKIFKDPKKIDRLCIVKVIEKESEFERAFFIVDNYEDYARQTEQKLYIGLFTEAQLKKAVIEEFIVGVQVNFNFFYSPLHSRLELLGTDTRRQTNFEGITKLPVNYQEEVLKKLAVSYDEASHTAVTVLESMLEEIFAIGERFVAATKKLSPPGVIGPFALQSFIVPGRPRKEIIVIDVSPRFPGSPGITATPYSSYLFGKPINVGKRIAMEIKEAQRLNKLDKILT